MANQATAATTATANSHTTVAASQRHTRTRTTHLQPPLVQLQGCTCRAGRTCLG
jgi:hypothetical protein